LKGFQNGGKGEGNPGIKNLNEKVPSLSPDAKKVDCEHEKRNALRKKTQSTKNDCCKNKVTPFPKRRKLGPKTFLGRRKRNGTRKSKLTLNSPMGETGLGRKTQSPCLKKKWSTRGRGKGDSHIGSQRKDGENSQGDIKRLLPGPQKSKGKRRD